MNYYRKLQTWRFKVVLNKLTLFNNTRNSDYLFQNVLCDCRQYLQHANTHDHRPEHSNFIFFTTRKIIKFHIFRTKNHAFKLKYCVSVLRKCYKNTAAARNKLFKCDILFTFHSNCSIEAQVRQAHIGRGIQSLKHLMCLCTLYKVILSVKFLFLGSRF